METKEGSITLEDVRWFAKTSDWLTPILGPRVNPVSYLSLRWNPFHNVRIKSLETFPEAVMEMIEWARTVDLEHISGWTAATASSLAGPLLVVFLYQK